MTILSAENISRVFGSAETEVLALEKISMQISAGEFVGLKGPSGCGKSTLLNILGLVDHPSAGSLVLCQELIDFSKTKQLEFLRRTRLGYVFQYFNLLPTLSALENVMLPALLKNSSKKRARQDATELLSKFGLARRIKHYPHELSGGEMQRVALARAIIHQPELILADEPTGNLDSHAGLGVLNALAEIAKSGKSVLMASHSEQALSRCDRVIELLDGKLK